MISAVCVGGYTLFLKHSVKLTLNTISDTHNRISGFLPNGLAPCWGGTESPLLQQKPFSCYIQDPDMRLVGLHSIQAAVNPSNSHGNT